MLLGTLIIVTARLSLTAAHIKSKNVDLGNEMKKEAKKRPKKKKKLEDALTVKPASIDDGSLSSKSKSNLDVGILGRTAKKKGVRALMIDERQLSDGSACTEGYVEYTNGVAVGGGCDGACCVGSGACEGFSGKVCKDGVSCMGTGACRDSNIPHVVRSCYGGVFSCFAGGDGTGSVGNVIDSCQGERACHLVGVGGDGNGSVGDITQSCLGDSSCYNVGYGYNGNGSVGDITQSCLGDSSCFKVGYGYYGNGSVGDITQSCLGDSSCEYLGFNSEVDANLHTCCVDPNACGGEESLPPECSTVSSRQPSDQPSSQPSESPSSLPSSQPSDQPSSQPSESPSSQPSSQPSESPSSQPSESPSSQPSSQPSDQPSSQPSESPSSQPSEPPSSQPSSIPSKAPSSSPSEHPSEQPSCTPSMSPTDPETTYLFYPDFSGSNEGCLNDGNQPNYMAANPRDYLYSTLDKCCKDYYSWNYDACMGLLGGLCARALWYPDWDGADEGCVDDGNEPAYMTDNSMFYLYSQKSDCCQAHYGWIYEECVGAKRGASFGLYYPDWDTTDNVCRNDGGQPKYMTNSPQYWMHETLNKCCNTNFQWAYVDCMGSAPSSTPGSTPATPGSTPADSPGYHMYYPDWLGSNMCIADGQQPAYMSKAPELWMYDTLKKCCKDRFNWAYTSCVGASSSGATGKYFYSSNTKKCVIDGVDEDAGDWVTLYNTKKQCCSSADWWNPDCNK